MTNGQTSTRDGFGKGLLEAGQNPNLVCLNADLLESCRVQDFAASYPNRFIQVGVAEQNMAGIAAGLAIGGKVPVITSFAIFSPGLNWLQIRQAIISQLKIVIASSHAGISNAGDGASHQALEDLAMMRTLPSMTVVVPADANQAEQAIKQAVELNWPSYLRLSKTPVPLLNTSEPFIIGQAQQLLANGQVTIIACGNFVHTALEVAQLLEQANIKTGVINLHTIKPLDEPTILKAAIESKLLVTIEEHQVAGGMGSAVSEYLTSIQPTRVLRLGIQDQFGYTGTTKEILTHLGLDAPQLFTKITQTLGQV